MTESDVILWTGVAVGLVGLAATASNGVALILLKIRNLAAMANDGSTTSSPGSSPHAVTTPRSWA